MFISLSSIAFVRYDTINSCEIFLTEDNVFKVRWFTDNGEILSDAHTGKVAATNYIKQIAEDIISYTKEINNEMGD